jgi:hypothetical protein
MTRLSKFLMVGLGTSLVLAACSTAEIKPTAETVVTAEVLVETAPSTSSGKDVRAEPVPTIPPTNLPTDSPQPIRANYPNLGPAPEIENEVWLNTDQPVTLASQRGKVVLVEFWTFG